MWIVALVILGIGIYAGYRFVQPPDHSEFTQKDLVEGLTRAGRMATNAPPPVYIPIDIKRPVRLAIGSLGFGGNSQNEGIQDLVLAQLTGAPGLELVERQSLERVLGELNLSLSGLVRAKDALRAGKLLKADWFLLGNTVAISGTNSVVLRLVDARTGILRDAGVFSIDRPAMEIAGDIAGFVRESRKNAASSELHTFLAIGAFEDLSSNRRQEAFPKQLRSYLTAAYRGSGVTLLEREAVDTLLQEVHLDMAGLVEGSETNAPQPMQSAYWLVDGAYQSYETTNFQVEIVLKVSRIFGQRNRITIRGRPNETLFAQVKSVIDSQMKTNTLVAWQTGNGEARAQMAVGKELADIGLRNSMSADVWDFLSVDNWEDIEAEEAARRRHNAEEAIRAFQTVLLLQPTNREAKMYIAACLRKWVMHRGEESLNYYRQIIEEPVRDKWTESAQMILHFNFPGGPEEKARWFESAAASQQSTNSPAYEYYHREAEMAEKDLVARSGGVPAQAMAEKELFENIMKDAHGLLQAPHLGANYFIDSYGTNRSEAARRLVELYPEMKVKASNSFPFVLAAVVSAQVDTNEPVIAELQQFLDQYGEHPDQVENAPTFWRQMSYPITDFAFDHKLYHLAASALEDQVRYALVDTNHSFSISEEQKLTLAYADMGIEEWGKALKIFEVYSNRPVPVGSGGPWGEAYTVVRTSKEAAYCRQKLGLSAVPNPLEFDMGKPVQCMCSPSTFITDEKGLWIGIEGQLLRLSFDLQTNFVVRLPISESTPIRSLALESSNVWIGTEGEGLIKYDGTKCRRFTMSDGLVVDSISCLQISGDVLWIGYTRGMGLLDLKTEKLTSFTSSITENLVGKFPPPRGEVHGLASGQSGEVWFTAENNGAARVRENGSSWDGVPDIGRVSAVAANSGRLALGQCWPYDFGDRPGPLGLVLLNIKDLKPQAMGTVEGLPSTLITTLTMDGDNLWVGGSGYVALVDVAKAKVRKYAYVQTRGYRRGVDRIQIGGGYVWAQFDWHLYRASLSGL